MKNKLLFFFLLSGLSSFAQVSRQQSLPKEITIQEHSLLKDYLSSNYLMDKKEWSLKENKVVRDPLGNSHFLFTVLFQGKPVIDHEIKASLNPKGEFIRIQLNGLKSTSFLTLDDTKPELIDAWILKGDKLIPVTLSKEKSEKGFLVQKIKTIQGELMEQRNLDLMDKSDSLNTTKVFNPDPLTSAQKVYGDGGGIWVNKNGMDYPEINAERKLVQVPLNFRNDTFFAAHKHAIILDLESPANTPFVSLVPNPEFTRSQNGFREMMCLYHINHLQEYLNSIGLDSIAKFQIKVDATAFQGQDQSRFSFDNDDPSLYFGTGGVPDAEDADVIVHEYTHGINYSIAPNSTNGLQRLAVEEANCDFMATQYSKAISDYKWREVFNWDGHNVFWDGRNTNSTKKYPDDLSSDYYSSSEIWSSMLNDLSLELGREVTTKILLGSIYFYTNGMEMQEAADLLVMADSLFYGRAHYEPLKSVLASRGFDVAMGIESLSGKLIGMKLINSSEFAQGIGNLKIQNPSNSLIELSIYSTDGKLNSRRTFTEEIEIPSGSLQAGVWILSLRNNTNQVAKFKLVKFN